MERKHISGKKAPYFKFFSLSENGHILFKILRENECSGEDYDEKCIDSGRGGT
jgi:hypothetical protein